MDGPSPPVDLVTGQVCVPTNSPEFGNVGTDPGAALTTAAANYFSLPNPGAGSAFNLLGARTLLWRGVITAGGNYNSLLALGTGWTTAGYDFLTDNSDPQKLLYILTQAGTGSTARRSYLSTGTLSAGHPHTAIAAADAAIEVLPSLFIDGLDVGATNTEGTGTGSLLTNSADIRIGRRDNNDVQLDGAVSVVAAWGRRLSAAEAAQISPDPMVLVTQPTRNYVKFYASLGVLSATEPASTVAGVATISPTASASPSEGGDTLSGGAATSLTASGAASELDDTLSGLVFGERVGTGSISAPADTLAGLALVERVGVGSASAPLDTAAGAAAVAIVAGLTAATADEQSTLSASSGVMVQGAVAVTSPLDSPSAAAEVLVFATGNVTSSADTTAGVVGVLVGAAGASAETGDTGLGNAQALVQAASAVAAPLELTLTSVYTEVKTRAIVTETTESVSAAGQMTVTAALAVLEPGGTLSSQIIMPVSATLSAAEPTPVLGDAAASVAVFSRVLDVVTDARVRLSDIDLYFD